MRANNNKSHLGYLNKLVDEYNKADHCCICKKLWLKKLNRVKKLLNSKSVIELELLSIIIF